MTLSQNPDMNPRRGLIPETLKSTKQLLSLSRVDFCLLNLVGCLDILDIDDFERTKYAS